MPTADAFNRPKPDRKIWRWRRESSTLRGGEECATPGTTVSFAAAGESTEPRGTYLDVRDPVPNTWVDDPLDVEDGEDTPLLPKHERSRPRRRPFHAARFLGQCSRTISKSLPRLTPCRMLLLILLLLLGAYFIYMFLAEITLNAPWMPGDDSLEFGDKPLPPPRPETSLTNYTLPLRARGRDVVDKTGRRFKLASVNWYGASDELFVPGGLDVRHRSDIAATIRRLGFNSVRLPYSDELVIKNPRIMAHLLAANPDLVGLRALDVFEAVVEALTDAGLGVVINNHITSATWCCGGNPCDSGWANDNLGRMCPVSQTEEDWILHWEEVMGRFTSNPLVFGVDLRNEVRGLWGTMPWSRWATAAERCGKRLQAMNPDWLIIVGGTESSNDLSGVAKRPVVLDVPDKVVYSAHVYSWSGWGSLQGRYAKRSYESFVKSMRRNWAYLIEGDVAPVWIGEFGAPHAPNVGDAHYWQNLLRYLKAIDADFAYWAINPRKPKDNEQETYGLVGDNWETLILDYRMRDMVELMNQ